MFPENMNISWTRKYLVSFHSVNPKMFDLKVTIRCSVSFRCHDLPTKVTAFHPPRRMRTMESSRTKWLCSELS